MSESRLQTLCVVARVRICGVCSHAFIDLSSEKKKWKKWLICPQGLQMNLNERHDHDAQPGVYDYTKTEQKSRFVSEDRQKIAVKCSFFQLEPYRFVDRPSKLAILPEDDAKC
ncbi:hypothetical protein EG68_07920 [Paragonimus skrjabini miyazakii]|uniref:Uncharacterized protein n=1 Tax=Paragonimus skrjabini miyazakii TaxID=59628 RepID=A0A8S9Z4L0_9TREM|nr:hypothetical protein EG68_07920 [Paragonimus skrjabini miyazakii]